MKIGIIHSCSWFSCHDFSDQQTELSHNGLVRIHWNESGLRMYKSRMDALLRGEGVTIAKKGP